MVPCRVTVPCSGEEDCPDWLQRLSPLEVEQLWALTDYGAQSLPLWVLLRSNKKEKKQ